MPKRWTRHLGLLLVWLLAGLLVGLWFGALAWTMCATVLLALVYTLRNVYLLDLAISTGKRTPPLAMRGLWPELNARVEKLRRKSRLRKKRYVQLVREVRESTGAISDGGIILNPEFEIEWFNPAATRLMGLERERDIGQRIDNLIRNPGFVEYLRNPALEPIIIPSPIDEDQSLSVSLIPYARDQILVIARDVTHETKLETTRRDFVANASHELRSPLTVISGYLEALGDDEEVPPSWESPLQEMMRQADRMTQILRDLIELTRLESGDEKAKTEFVGVGEMLGKIIDEFGKRGEMPAIELHVESDVALLGSESELHSVFYNLIGNAMRFTPASGRVDVTWRGDEHSAVFEGGDTGIGIPAELIPRLTERFYRVDTTRSRATGGTGLGLAIVKHALQRHDATLEIESEEGVGSTFSCHFPPHRIVARERDASVGV